MVSLLFEIRGWFGGVLSVRGFRWEGGLSIE